MTVRPPPIGDRTLTDNFRASEWQLPYHFRSSGRSERNKGHLCTPQMTSSKSDPPKTFAPSAPPILLILLILSTLLPPRLPRRSLKLPPVQPSSTATRRRPASKPNRTGAPLQANAPDRTKSESTPDQKRTDPEPKVENFSQLIANALPQIPKHKKRANQPNQPTNRPRPTPHQRSPLLLSNTQSATAKWD